MTIAPFSAIAKGMQQVEDRAERARIIGTVPVFPDKERTPEATKARRERACKDFDFFERTYFPPEAFPDGHWKSGKYHKRMVREAQLPGVYFSVGPRGHGKTTKLIILFSWLVVSGQHTLAATYAETIAKAQSILQDIHDVITENDRIKHDFEIEPIVENEDEFAFRTIDGKLRTIRPFGEGRSLRGYVRRFARPSLIYGDDIETLTSSFEKKSVDLRIGRLRETAASMRANGTFIVAANNFDERSAINTIIEQSKNHTLNKRWRVTVSMAWQNGKPLWPERYPATSEAELMEMCGAADEVDWQNNWMQNPTLPAGVIFTQDHIHWYTELPKDVRSIGYVDPNLARKGKGDTTAMMLIQYSPGQDKFYVRLRCRSYADATELLNDYLALCKVRRMRGMAMDGHVNQESHWRNHVKAWSKENQRPYPPLFYQHYIVDDLATNAQAIWNGDRILFDATQRGTEEMVVALRQINTFTTKKAKGKDDAPDALICGLQFVHEKNLMRKSSEDDYATTAVGDHY